MDFFPNIKFAIIIPTYYRQNKKTKAYLMRSIESVVRQSYKHWDLIIVGDQYEHENELLDIISFFRHQLKQQTKQKYKNKIHYLRNELVERNYITHKTLLWFCAGAHSVNMGLHFARENLYKYYCHLDDDDYWKQNHLFEIAQIYNTYPNCVFVNTKAKYLDMYLPSENIEIYENNKKPEAGKMVHCSFSFDLQRVPFFYDSAIRECGIHIQLDASDALMLKKIHRFLDENPQYCSIYVPVLTCFHDEECQSIV